MKLPYQVLYDLADAQNNFEKLQAHGLADDTAAGGDLQGTLPKPKLAKQTVGLCSVATITAANAAFSNFAGWTTTTSGTFLTASAAGLTARKAGVYLAKARIRWDAGVTGVRATYVSLNAAVDLDSEVAQPASTQQPGLLSVWLGALSAGDVISAGYFQNQGGAVATLSASLYAYWLGNTS